MSDLRRPTSNHHFPNLRNEEEDLTLDSVCMSALVFSFSRVSNQNGVTRLHNIVEIYHSDREPSICSGAEVWRV